MPAIEGNRQATNIAPVACMTGADAIRAAAAVRERRRSLFFVAEAPRIAEAPQPVKAEPEKVVPVEPKKCGLPCTASFLFVPSLAIVEPSPVAPKLGITDVLRAMVSVTGISRHDLLSQRRVMPVAQARQITMLLCRMLTDKSYPEIGRRLGGKDHSTVVHAVHKYDWMIPILREKVPEGSPLIAYATAAWALYQTGRQQSVAA